MKPSLNQILERILMWKIETKSGYNDGWTKRHYRSFLDKIREAVREEPTKTVLPDDPGLAQDDEFNF
tara:strand:- start:2279 stop:2479 length:201 start_codon:yes stop_codon:yes gene_type:complete